MESVANHNGASRSRRVNARALPRFKIAFSETRRAIGARLFADDFQMSLDITKVENVRERSGKIIARCPACAEAGHDRKGEHLVVNEDGRFGCILYPGDSPEAKEHRRRIFALCGDQTTKPLAVHLSRTPGTARTPFDKSHAYSCNKQGGIVKTPWTAFLGA